MNRLFAAAMSSGTGASVFSRLLVVRRAEPGHGVAVKLLLGAAVIGLRLWLIVVVTELIDPAHQRRSEACLVGAGSIGRDVAEAEAAAAEDVDRGYVSLFIKLGYCFLTQFVAHRLLLSRCENSGCYMADQPPSTNNWLPVVKEESSQARNSAARATSSGWPNRCIACRLAQRWRVA